MCENADRVGEGKEKHVIDKFSFGSKKSILGGDKGYEKLWQDLKKFFEQTYSSERMKVVVQMKSEDNLVSLRKQVQELFSLIPNKGLGSPNYCFFP
mmetsp:Transcript_36952/g.35661  ORF Transcript_36952/g.35661 Transcript_36952/m.35661 type:complete len:96 (+) Transcript_36952:28-315(+)